MMAITQTSSSGLLQRLTSLEESSRSDQMARMGEVESLVRRSEVLEGEMAALRIEVSLDDVQLPRLPRMVRS
jgi:hypothetical protein